MPLCSAVGALSLPVLTLPFAHVTLPAECVAKREQIHSSGCVPMASASPFPQEFERLWMMHSSGICAALVSLFSGEPCSIRQPPRGTTN